MFFFVRIRLWSEFRLYFSRLKTAVPDHQGADPAGFVDKALYQANTEGRNCDRG